MRLVKHIVTYPKCTQLNPKSGCTFKTCICTETRRTSVKIILMLAFFIIFVNSHYSHQLFAAETSKNNYKLPKGFAPLTDDKDPASGLPLTIRCEADGSEMALVPAGGFVMGSDDIGNDESPQHTVYLDTYYIDKYEITNAQFKKFCDKTRFQYPENPPWDSVYFLSKPDNPVVLIHWHTAQSYLKWTGKRLPTEAEWEKAARGVDAMLYPWGNDHDLSRCNLDSSKDNFQYTSPVGVFTNGISPYGCYDMIGNVTEWCNDWHEPNYYKFTVKDNPPGPEEGATRVLRGGSYKDNDEIQCARRSEASPIAVNVNVGFRCVLKPLP